MYEIRRRRAFIRALEQLLAVRRTLEGAVDEELPNGDQADMHGVVLIAKLLNTVDRAIEDIRDHTSGNHQRCSWPKARKR